MKIVTKVYKRNKQNADIKAFAAKYLLRIVKMWAKLKTKKDNQSASIPDSSAYFGNPF